MNEFELIHRYFKKHDQDVSVIKGIGDDAAIIKTSKGQNLVISTDTLLEGVHFPTRMSPHDIGYRCVAVNISDMAAMGATPRWLTLALSLPSFDQEWLENFSLGLFAAAKEYKVTLVGGDTTSGQQLTITISITGEVKSNSAITRARARPGDLLFVTGTIGDAAAGLSLIGDTNTLGEDEQLLMERFSRPSARIEVGQSLLDIASAAFDVSDGLFADTGKLGFYYGFSLFVLENPEIDNTNSTKGIYGWSGYHNTHFWIDPKKNLYGLFMTRTVPFSFEIQKQFRAAVYSNI